jgi:hypothetical protein
MSRLHWVFAIFVCCPFIGGHQDIPTAGDRETVWSEYLAGVVAGEAEYRLPNGSRVDILTDDVAWEVEWSDKWEESIGQSLFYGIATDRRPGVWLLLRGEFDEDYLQCLAVVDHLRSRGVAMAFRVEVVK